MKIIVRPFKELPKHIKFSKYIMEKSTGFVYFMSFGKTYYIPVTKELQKVIKLSGKYAKKLDIEEMLRDLITSLYIQYRDTVGSETFRTLWQELDNSLRKKYSKPLMEKITNRMVMIEDKRNNIQK